MNAIRLLLCLSLLLLACSSPAPRPRGADRVRPTETQDPPAERIALVIGNASYARLPPLRNPIRDARLMAEVLRDKGFTLMGGQALEDADEAVMKRAIEDFRDRLKVSLNAVGLFYYAGHGGEYKDINYLLPVDLDLNPAANVLNHGIRVTDLLTQMGDATPRLKLVILDACRDAGLFPGDQRDFAAGFKGYERGELPKGSFIAFATAPGHTASDGTGGHSPFAIVVAEVLAGPGDSIFNLFNRITLRVQDATGAQDPQIPVSSSNGIPETDLFPFGRPDAGPSSPSLDLAFWNSIKNSRNPAEFRTYLQKYPTGEFVELARTRLVELEGPTQPGRRDDPPVFPPPVSTPFRAGQVTRDCPDCPEMMAIPGGEFWMGSEAEASEMPRHRVKVPDFWMGRYEVTRGEYAAFAKATGRPDKLCQVITGGEDFGKAAAAAMDGRYFQKPVDEWQFRGELLTGQTWRRFEFPQTDRHPVVCVSHDDAVEYTRWLSKITGRTYRLPSESEWEYAAIAGSDAAPRHGSDHQEVCRLGNFRDERFMQPFMSTFNYLKEHPELQSRFPLEDFLRCDDGYSHTAPVGQFQPNGFGLHDMIGNVWEWVADCLHDDYRGAPTDGSAWLQSGAECQSHVQKGGSYGFPILRAAIRGGNPILGYLDRNSGFRVARAR